MESKACFIMQIFHMLKHGEFEEAIEKMNKEFPKWRNVEFFNPDNAKAVEYLFNVVLKE